MWHKATVHTVHTREGGEVGGKAEVSAGQQQRVSGVREVKEDSQVSSCKCNQGRLLPDLCLECAHTVSLVPVSTAWPHSAVMVRSPLSRNAVCSVGLSMTLYLTTMTVVAGVTETGGHTRSHCQGQVTEVQAPALHWYRPDSMMQFLLSVQSAVSPS